MASGESRRRVRSAPRLFGATRSRFGVVDLNEPQRFRDRSIFLPYLKPRVQNRTLAAALTMARHIFLMRCPKPLLDASLRLIQGSGFRADDLVRGGGGALAICYREAAPA